MIDIQSQIYNQISKILSQNYKPILLVLNPQTAEKLKEEMGLKWYPPEGLPQEIKLDNLSILFDMKVYVDSSVPDFQVIDNRSWVDQKF